MRVEIGQVISQILAFLIMYLLLKRYAWKPLLKTMEERKQRITADFQSIEEQKKALSLENERYQQRLDEIEEKAQAKMQEAVNKGIETAKKIQDDAQQKAKEILAQAQVELQKEIAKAKVQLKEEFVNISLAAAEKILQKNLNPEEQRKLVLDFVEQSEFH